MQSSLSRVWTFVALCLGCALGLGVYAYHAYRIRPRTVSPTQALWSSAAARESLREKPRQIFFRYTGLDDHYGKLAVVDFPGPGVPRFIEAFSCNVVHVARGQGICLAADRGMFTTYTAELFDSSFQSRFKIPLQGGPSRARVSPDGKMAGLTVFLSGHGYASVDFSTQTLLIDTARGTVLADMESFQVTRGGRPFQAKDFNFWGVTFTPDSNRFYCTLSSNRKHYLVACDAAARTASVLHENVECPSVSPDGSHIAYKKRFIIDGRLIWQLHVLDLATMQETALAEKRSVDDQLEWLDDDHVLYTVSDDPGGSSAITNVWKVAVAGQAPPELFLSRAYSPAVVR